MSTLSVNGKPLQIVGTAAWSAHYAGIEAQCYIQEALKALAKKPVDMLVFEQPEEGRMQIRAAGHDLATDSVLDETTVIMSTESLPIKKFWFKLDDCGTHYIGTFLFPEDF